MRLTVRFDLLEMAIIGFAAVIALDCLIRAVPPPNPGPVTPEEEPAHES
jgi:hypothetical protein